MSIHRRIAQALVQRKAKDVVALDLRQIAPFIADYFVIATAYTPEHARALADEVEEIAPVHHVEGYSHGYWVLVDAGEVVVHIMLEEAREFYSLETLWGDAPKEHYEG